MSAFFDALYIYINLDLNCVRSQLKKLTIFFIFLI